MPLPYFYPRSPCGERRKTYQPDNTAVTISIHALLAESDNFRRSVKCPISNFYPRSPCGERQDRPRPSAGINNFYPRSPCGERPIMNNIIFVPRKFLSTLSLRRATLTGFFRSLEDHNFYPRSPCGERLTGLGIGLYLVTISIHALLAESDRELVRLVGVDRIFLSTLSLRRATKLHINRPTETIIFLSTLSLRRATYQYIS